MNTKRITRLALSVSAALILSLIENSFPPLLAFAPGVKAGLGNIVCLTVLIISGAADAYIVLLVRCLAVSVFGGNASALMYSVPAGIVSLSVQWIMYELLFPKIGLVSVSIAGACVHNAVQLAVASVIVRTNLFAVLPIMMFASVIAGVFTGLAAWFTVKYLPKKTYMDMAVQTRG